jgi:ABC-2 type transport system permease protein
METIVRTELKEKRPLQPVTARGWWRGLGNLLRKELGEWFGTRKWLMQTLIWVLIINGITTIIMVTESAEGAMTNVELANEVLSTFLQMLVMVVGIGLVVTVQGAIVGEKQLGTAAWVMSKPVSRPAFIVAKVIANIIGFGVTAVLIPTIIFLLETRLVVPLPIDIVPFLAGLAVVALSLLFYLMLALMLGTIYDSRGAITGIGIGLLLAGLLISGMVPQVIQLATPWLLPDIAVGLALQQPLPDIWFVPLIANGLWIVVFTAVALWRFSREEF